MKLFTAGGGGGEGEALAPFYKQKNLETSHQSKLAAKDGRVNLIRPLQVIRFNRERRIHVKVGCLRVWFHRYFFHLHATKLVLYGEQLKVRSRLDDKKKWLKKIYGEKTQKNQNKKNKLLINARFYSLALKRKDFLL